MLYMNDYDIDRAEQEWASHPVLGPATRTLVSLRDWTDEHSDGWAYWPKPCKAARALQQLIAYDFASATPEALRAALRPVKAFRTRQGADFEITEA